MSRERSAVRGFLIAGRVQGVGFRAFVRSEAHRLGLDGWVRNLPDGRVEAVASGAPEAIAGLRERLRKGPLGARVTAVDEFETAAPERSGFEVAF